MINSIKRTIINWVSEHKKLTYIIGGAVGFPLLLAALIGTFGFCLWLFSLVLGTQLGAVAMFSMILGGIAGFFIWNLNND